MEDWSLPATSITVNVSGHDATTLGGLPPSFYLNAANLTGTIADARLSGNYSQISALTRNTNNSALFLKGGDISLGSGAFIHLYGKDSGLYGGMFIDSSAVYFREITGTYNLTSITGTGVVIHNNTPSTSTTTGAITIAGGQGIQGDQYVGGFSSLGGDANHPAIKIKVLTGTTASTEGGSSSVLHGVTATKIVLISILVEYAPNSFVPASHNIGPGYYFDFYSDTGNVHIFNKTANSSNILSKPFKVTIIYTA